MRALWRRPVFVLLSGLVLEVLAARFARIRLRLLREAGDRFRFGVVDVKDRQELGDLQHFLELGA